MSFIVPEKFRITTGLLGSDSSYGNNGAFWVKTKNVFSLSLLAIKWVGSMSVFHFRHVVQLGKRCVSSSPYFGVKMTA